VQSGWVWLTFAEEVVPNRLGLVDLLLVESEYVEQCDIINVNGNTDLWRHSWI